MQRRSKVQSLQINEYVLFLPQPAQGRIYKSEVNKVLVTLYKVLGVHHHNQITCFNTIVYQSYTYTSFKIPAKLQRVKDRAARLFYQPLTFT